MALPSRWELERFFNKVASEGSACIHIDPAKPDSEVTSVSIFDQGQGYSNNLGALGGLGRAGLGGLLGGTGQLAQQAINPDPRALLTQRSAQANFNYLCRGSFPNEIERLRARDAADALERKLQRINAETKITSFNKKDYSHVPLFVERLQAEINDWLKPIRRG